MSSEVEIKRVKALPAISHWVLMILVSIGVMLVAWVSRTVSPGKWWVIHGWWIPPIYLMVVVEILGKISPRLRPTRAQWGLFMIVFYIFVGKWALFAFTGSTNLFDVVNPFFKGWGVVAAHNPVLRETYMNLNIPRWLVPLDAVEAEKVWAGLAPGQTPNWGVWIGPIIAWSTIIVSTILISVFSTFLFWGPQWNETERLAFGAVIPTTALVNTFESRDEKGRSLLFDFRKTTTKALWVSAVIGFITSAPFYWKQLFGAPWLTLGGSVGWIAVDLNPYTRNVLPGSNFYSAFAYPTVVLCIILPYTAIISLLVGWLIFHVVYPPLGIAAGWFPVGANYGLSYPMPWTVWLYGGFGLGLVLYWLWGMRGRFVRAFRALVGEDYTVNGISMKWGLAGLVISMLIFLAIWTAAGMNILLAALLLVFFILTDIISGKAFAAFSPIGSGCYGALPMFAWPAGPALGLWGWSPPNTSTSLAVYSIASQGMGHCFSFYNSMGMTGMSLIYKTSYDTGCEMKETLKFLITLLVIGTPLFMVFSTWLDYNVGFTNLAESSQSAVGGNYPGAALNYGLDSLAGYWLGSPSAFWTQTLIGGVIAVILQFLRTTFAWFPIDPFWIWMTLTMMAPMLGWLTLTAGLALKVVLFKSLGPRRATDYAIPIMTGLMIGQCLLYLFSGIFYLQTIGIPNLQAHWG